MSSAVCIVQAFDWVRFASRAMIRLYGFPRSLNVEPVAIVLAHKGRQTAVADRALIDQMGEEITASLDVFEALLTGRDYLMWNMLSAADCAVYPLLKYVDFQDPEDTERFHQILREYETRGGHHSRLEAWLGRMASHPQVPV